AFHHVAPWSQEIAPLTRAVHAPLRISLILIMSVCHSDDVGGCVMGSLLGVVCSCIRLSLLTEISGVLSNALAKAAGSSAMITPGAQPNVGHTGMSLGHKVPRRSLIAFACSGAHT